MIRPLKGRNDSAEGIKTFRGGRMPHAQEEQPMTARITASTLYWIGVRQGMKMPRLRQQRRALPLPQGISR